MGYDKSLAQNNKRRISEKTLLTFAFIGGTFGSILAIFIFSHKISKTSYLLKFFWIILIQLSILYWWYKP